MKRKASIISLDKNIRKIRNSFINNNKYSLEEVFDNYVDFGLLKFSDSIFIDSDMDLDIIKKVEKYCLDNNKEFFIYASSINLRKSKIKAIDDLCFLNLKPYQISKFNSIIKRLFDIIISFVFIVFSLPLFIFIYFLIKTFDKGPALYLQKRLTSNEREFVIFKFRTMKVNAEEETGVTLSTINDPRLTRIGKFLRKHRLDELPQIFNVLIGDMSLVGPRPERSYYVQKYKELNDYYKYRFNVKAGITGYAQVYGKYDSTYEEKLNYDLYYISNYSIFKDVKILSRTLIYFVSIKPSSRKDIKNKKYNRKVL